MKRTTLLVTVGVSVLALLAVVVGSGVASASHNDQPNPPQDFTTGGGTVVQTQGLATIAEKFAFSGYDEDAIGPTPGARNGHYVYQQTTTSPTGSTTLELEGRVSCVWVEANSAFFGGPIEKTNDPDFEGMFAFFDVVDNDQPPGNGADPDQFLFEFSTSSSGICAVPIFGFPITSGNIVVHDGQPTPPGPNAAQADAVTEEEALQQRKDLAIE